MKRGILIKFCAYFVRIFASVQNACDLKQTALLAEGGDLQRKLVKA